MDMEAIKDLEAMVDRTIKGPAVHIDMPELNEDQKRALQDTAALAHATPELLAQLKSAREIARLNYDAARVLEKHLNDVTRSSKDVSAALAYQLTEAAFLRGALISLLRKLGDERYTRPWLIGGVREILLASPNDVVAVQQLRRDLVDAVKLIVPETLTPAIRGILEQLSEAEAAMDKPIGEGR